MFQDRIEADPFKTISGTVNGDRSPSQIKKISSMAMTLNPVMLATTGSAEVPTKDFRTNE